MIQRSSVWVLLTFPLFLSLNIEGTISDSNILSWKDKYSCFVKEFSHISLKIWESSPCGFQSRQCKFETHMTFISYGTWRERDMSGRYSAVRCCSPCITLKGFTSKHVPFKNPSGISVRAFGLRCVGHFSHWTQGNLNILSCHVRTRSVALFEKCCDSRLITSDNLLLVVFEVYIRHTDTHTSSFTQTNLHPITKILHKTFFQNGEILSAYWTFQERS